jgi:hypothetical protein
MGWIRMVSSFAEEALGDRVGSGSCRRCDAAGVSNHVRIAFAQTEGLFGLQ